MLYKFDVHHTIAVWWACMCEKERYMCKEGEFKFIQQIKMSSQQYQADTRPNCNPLFFMSL